MKFGVVIFPGSNCDRDCYWAVSRVLGQEAKYLWYQERDLSDLDCVILPGGFSFGDYLRAGALVRFSPVMEAVREYASRGGLVIGICNGFQILLEAGLLPGAMMRNRNLRFICEYVHIRVERTDTPFTCLFKEGEVLKIPIAHMEGNYFADEATLAGLKANNQVVFRYCSPEGDVSEEYNPNGSLENIAGICNEAGNVLGMMPHPERCCEALLGSEDGRRIFQSIVSHLSGVMA
ncbi:MAG TPA: phosphoribosylformylglycinamidine synthase subunit PurQ [Thermosulfidibacter takaii]|uniref:Phosphoribosylformylglycinamidine synthase subunit PurQ n=1 Tax=Thermosulfidibacter takaii TaxID=412593 RepID=A0A7C0Y6D9_9BACT|nr:phosphoribosylformylglycinamidine synthase subunit PurQ [Thermosulfidibacter takaii]